MNGTDFPVLHERLNEMAEALGGKTISPKGLSVWVQTLREFPLPDIVDALTGWAKRSTKMPAPADVWKFLNDRRTDSLEQQAASNKRRFQAEAASTFRRDPAFAKKIRALVVDLKDRPVNGPKEWAQVIHQRFLADRTNPDGSDISMTQISFACQALRIPLKDAYDEREQRRSGVTV